MEKITGTTIKKMKNKLSFFNFEHMCFFSDGLDQRFYLCAWKVIALIIYIKLFTIHRNVFNTCSGFSGLIIVFISKETKQKQFLCYKQKRFYDI